MELSNTQILALSKLITAKEAKKASGDLTPGDHPVDFTVRVSGSLKRGEDYEQKIVAKADPWTILAAALSHLNGVTVQSLVTEALTADPDLVKSIKASAKTALAEVKAPTLTPCNGKVTAKVAADIA
jgi:hypothetical protein